MVKRILYVFFFLLALAANVMAAEPTKDDAVSMVKKAVDFYKANGKEKLLVEMSIKDGPFHQGELYVYATDLKYVMLAHPVNSKLIGKANIDVPDVDGKLYRKEMVEVANTKGSGWVDYKYKNPASGKVEAKTSYVLKVDDMIFVCGIYK